MVYVDKRGEVTWQAINSGFIGQIFFLKKNYPTAKEYLQADYNINKNNEPNIAANTLQWLARISLIEGKEDSALFLVKEALQFAVEIGRGSRMHRHRGVLVGVRLLDLGRRCHFAEQALADGEKLLGEIGDCRLVKLLTGDDEVAHLDGVDAFFRPGR